MPKMTKTLSATSLKDLEIKIDNFKRIVTVISVSPVGQYTYGWYYAEIEYIGENY